MISLRDILNILIREVTMSSINHVSKVTCVDKKCEASTISKTVIFLVSSDKPQTHWYLSSVKQLTRQRNNAIDKISFDNFLTNIALTRLILCRSEEHTSQL